MVLEQKERGIIPVGQDGRQIIAGVFGRGSLSRKGLTGLVISNPQLIQPVAAIAYCIPVPIDALTKPAQLRVVRKKLGPVMGIIEAEIPSFLPKAPTFAQRISEYKDTLAHNPEAVDVPDAEIALRVFLDIVNDTAITGQPSHFQEARQFYDHMCDAVEANRGDIPREAEQTWCGLGQDLLVAHHIQGIEDLGPYQKGIEGVRKVRGEADFNGLVRAIIILGRATAVLQNDRSQEERLKRLSKKTLELTMELRHQYPDKVRQIKRIFGAGPGIHLYGFVEEPGGPDLTSAEIRDFDRTPLR